VIYEYYPFNSLLEIVKSELSMFRRKEKGLFCQGTFPTSNPELGGGEGGGKLRIMAKIKRISK
jgi:hypothetical protein